jgi:hypothetical protein
MPYLFQKVNPSHWPIQWVPANGLGKSSNSSHSNVEKPVPCLAGPEI